MKQHVYAFVYPRTLQLFHAIVILKVLGLITKQQLTKCIKKLKCTGIIILNINCNILVS